MRLKNKYLFAPLIFILSFSLSLLIWNFIKSYYAVVIINTAVFVNNLISGTYTASSEAGANIVVLHQVKQFVTNTGDLADLALTITIKISTFTFNFPLTISLVWGISPLIRLKYRKFIEILLFLLFIHFCYVFTLIGLQQYHYMVQAGIINNSTVLKLFWEYTWAFADNLLIRFEPFLVPVYVYLTSVKNKRG